MSAKPVEGYALTSDDCMGLMTLRAGQQTMAEFAKHIGAPLASQDYENRVKWLDGFMERIGATDMVRQMQGYKIDVSALGVTSSD